MVRAVLRNILGHHWFFFFFFSLFGRYWLGIVEQTGASRFIRLR